LGLGRETEGGAASAQAEVTRKLNVFLLTLSLQRERLMLERLGVVVLAWRRAYEVYGNGALRRWWILD
jgi:hypothetical protein